MTAPKKENEPLVLPEIRIGLMSIRIVGITQLVLNPLTKPKALEILKGMMTSSEPKSQKKTQRPPKNPVEEFMKALETMDNQKPIQFGKNLDIWAEGRFGIRACAIKNAIIASARCTDTTMVDVRMAVQVGPSYDSAELLEIEADRAVMRLDTVRQGPRTNRTIDIRSRPCFFPWAIEVPIRYNLGIISRNAVINLMNHAGEANGLGCYRPFGESTSGTWGRFEIARVRDLGVAVRKIDIVEREET